MENAVKIKFEEIHGTPGPFRRAFARWALAALELDPKSLDARAVAEISRRRFSDSELFLLKDVFDSLAEAFGRRREYGLCRLFWLAGSKALRTASFWTGRSKRRSRPAWFAGRKGAY